MKEKVGRSKLLNLAITSFNKRKNKSYHCLRPLPLRLGDHFGECFFSIPITNYYVEENHKMIWKCKRLK